MSLIAHCFRFVASPCRRSAMHRRKGAYSSSSKKKTTSGGSHSLGGARAAAAKSAGRSAASSSSNSAHVPTYFPRNIEAARNKVSGTPHGARSRAASVSHEFSQSHTRHRQLRNGTSADCSTDDANSAITTQRVRDTLFMSYSMCSFVITSLYSR